MVAGQTERRLAAGPRRIRLRSRSSSSCPFPQACDARDGQACGLHPLAHAPRASEAGNIVCSQPGKGPLIPMRLRHHWGRARRTLPRTLLLAASGAAVATSSAIPPAEAGSVHLRLPAPGGPRRRAPTAPSTQAAEARSDLDRFSRLWYTQHTQDRLHDGSSAVALAPAGRHPRLPQQGAGRRATAELVSVTQLLPLPSGGEGWRSISSALQAIAERRSVMRVAAFPRCWSSCEGVVP